MGCSSSRATQVAENKVNANARKPRVLVAFYSTYGHCYQLAKAAAEGAKAGGAEVDLRRVAEVLPAEVLEKMHALEAQKAFADVPEANATELGSYDGIILVSSTRFGTVATAMRTFLDRTGQLWFQGQLIGKVGAGMIATATQHGGQEKAFASLRNFFLHQGMVVVGLPPSFAAQSKIDTMEGGSYYGATTIAGSDGSRMPSEQELAGASFQGKYVAEVAGRLVA